MKAKKLLKRILDSRPGKKTAKKVTKRNKKFLKNLYTLNNHVDEPIENVATDVEDTTKVGIYTNIDSKKAMLDYVKDIITAANTDLDEDLVNAKAVNNFELGIFTFTFYDDQNPYRVLVSKDFDVNLLKSLRAEVKVEHKNVDPDPNAK